MAHNLLSLVIMNASELDPITLGMCSCVSTNTRDIVQSLGWKKAKMYCIEPSDGSKCVKCAASKRVISVFGYCLPCMDDVSVVGATSAKKDWYLDESDLNNLLVNKKYVARYRQFIRMYLQKDVVIAAIIKFGGPEKLQEKLDNRMKRCARGSVSAAKQKRLDAIAKLQLDTSSQKWDLCVADYIANGVGGLKRVKKRLSRWDEFHTIIENHVEAAYREFAMAFVERCVGEEDVDILSYINNAIAAKKVRQIRTGTLEHALAEHGLHLREDSSVCKQYINNERDDLHDVVRIMREMQYLHAHTKYKSIMDNLIARFRNEIREMYGWLPYEEYREVLQEEIPTLSEEAKKQAMKTKAQKNVPDFMRTYCHA
jgi:hypothetical protein